MNGPTSKTSSYFVEFAKSGRSKCKKCKESIDKDTIRIIVEVEGGEYTLSSNYHTTCFPIPKQYKAQSATYFVQNVLQDKSKFNDGNTSKMVLPDHEFELIMALEEGNSSSGGKKRKSLSADGTATSDGNPIVELKRAYIERYGEDAKKSKSASSSKKAKKGTPNDENVPNDASLNHDVVVLDVVSSSSSGAGRKDMVDLYGIYHKNTIDELKDILRYNRQYMTGTKDVLLYKVLDGCYYNGRLTFCPLCTTGKLKIVFETNTNQPIIQCNGTFDETIQRRMECSYTTVPSDPAIVRDTPFYTPDHPPSDIDNERMDVYEENIKNGITTIANTNSNNSKGNSIEHKKQRMIQYYKDATTKVVEWNLSSRDGIRSATAGLVDILTLPKSQLESMLLPEVVSSSSSYSGTKKEDNDDDTIRINLPSEGDIKQIIGPIIATNKEKSVHEVIDIIIQKYGWVCDVQAKQSINEQSIASIVKHPSNVALVMALQELATLYFKTGNSNAGSSYKKMIATIQSVPYAITSENAKSLGSGKNKLPNIGKSSADKIYEFVTTGTIQKLIDKRAEAM